MLKWAAAGRFWMLWERSGAKGAIAIDPSPDLVVKATHHLDNCLPILGERTFDIMIKVVGQGMEIVDIAQTQREKTTFIDYIKDDLQELAVHWGYKTR